MPFDMDFVTLLSFRFTAIAENERFVAFGRLDVLTASRQSYSMVTLVEMGNPNERRKVCDA